jgi:hypothetical protein
MKLTPVNRIYSVPGIWAVAGGAVALALAGLTVFLLRPFVPLLNEPWAVTGVFVAATVFGFITSAVQCVKAGEKILRQLQVKIRGVYGFTLSMETLNELLPYKARFGWSTARGIYGSVTRSLPIGTEVRTLVRDGEVFRFETTMLQKDVVTPLYDIREVPTLDRQL